MNKKALQLSINFIVWLIIALVVFGMGVTLFTKFFKEAEDIRENLDIQTKKELQTRMMSSPEQVVIYPTTLKIQKGKGDIFGVGILNIGATGNFIVTTQQTACYNSDGSSMACLEDEIVSIPSISRTIESNQRDIIEIPVRAQAGIASGKYAIKVEVRDSSDNQMSSNIVYVNVP